MATITYGVDLDYVLTFYPQLQVSPTSPIKPTTIDTIINNAAAELNAVIVAVFGTGAPQAITDGRPVVDGGDGSQADAYNRCRGLVFDLMHLSLVNAAAHVLADTTDQELLYQRTKDLRADLRRDPRGMVGYIVPPDSYTPGSNDVVQSLHLNTSTSCARQRRTYGGRGYGRDEKAFKF